MNSVDAATLAILEARAERLRDVPTDSEDSDILWCAAFPLGDERFAVPLPNMLAVLPLAAVTAVPLSPNEMLGMLRFQGSLIPAISLASMLVGRAVHRDPVALIVVQEDGGRRVALDCEEIPTVVGFQRSQLALTHNQTEEPYVELADESGDPIHYLHVAALLKLGALDGP